MAFHAVQVQGDARAERNGQFEVVTDWENNSRNIVIEDMSSMAAAEMAAAILNDSTKIDAGFEFTTANGKKAEIERRRGDHCIVKVWNAPRHIARSMQTLAWVARQIGEVEGRVIEAAVRRAGEVSKALYSIDALPDQAMRLAASIKEIQTQGGDLTPAIDQIAYLRYILNGIPGIYTIDPKSETVNNWLTGK